MSNFFKSNRRLCLIRFSLTHVYIDSGVQIFDEPQLRVLAESNIFRNLSVECLDGHSHLSYQFKLLLILLPSQFNHVLWCLHRLLQIRDLAMQTQFIALWYSQLYFQVPAHALQLFTLLDLLVVLFHKLFQHLFFLLKLLDFDLSLLISETGFQGLQLLMHFLVVDFQFNIH